MFLAVLQSPAGFSRLVAVKRAHPHLVAEAAFRRAFIREARLAAAVRHANVVGVLDVEEHAGEVALVMEYVEGATLAEIRDAVGILPLPVAAQVILGVARGLHAAHETVDLAGAPLLLVHRDVSPHNVLVGLDGVSRISDFGVATALGELAGERSRSPALCGKAGYIAPEYLRTLRGDRRADVFSLGVVAWESLTGRRLFRGPTDFQTLEQVLNAEIPAPSSVHAALPPALDAVIFRALARDPDRRFESAQTFAQAFREVLLEQGALGQPEDASEIVRAAAGDALAARRLQLQHALGAEREETLTGRSPDEATAAIRIQPSVPEVRSMVADGPAEPRVPPRRRWLRAAVIASAVAAALALFLFTRAPRAPLALTDASARSDPRTLAAPSARSAPPSLAGSGGLRPATTLERAPSAALVASSTVAKGHPAPRAPRVAPLTRERMPDKAPPNPYRTRQPRAE